MGLLNDGHVQCLSFIQIIVVDLQPSELACLTGHSDRVLSVSCGSDNTLCTSSLDNTIRVWKPQLQVTADQVKGHDAEVTASCWPSGGDFVVTGSADGVLKLWNLKQGIQLAKCSYTLKVCTEGTPAKSHKF